MKFFLENKDMAASHPPRPRKESELKDLLYKFARGISRDPDRYYIAHDDAAAIQRTIDAYVAAYQRGKAPGTKTRGAVKEKNNARRAAERIHSDFYNLIKNDPGVSESDRIGIGVKVVNLKRRKIRVPGRAPKITAVSAVPSKHTLKFHDVATLDLGKADSGGREGVKGKPRGAAFVQLYAAIGVGGGGAAGKKQPLTDAREVGLFTRNPIIVEHKEADNGKQACYWARYISPKGERGPWSKMTTMAIVA